MIQKIFKLRIGLDEIFIDSSSYRRKGFKNIEKNELTNLVYKSCYENYKLKSEIIAQSTFPVIENVYKSHSGQYKNIVIPFSDGVKTMNVVTNLEEAYETKGKNIQFSIEKKLLFL